MGVANSGSGVIVHAIAIDHAMAIDHGRKAKTGRGSESLRVT
jgi:hypothetical protein